MSVQIQTVGRFRGGHAAWGAMIGDARMGGAVNDALNGQTEAEFYALYAALDQGIKRGSVLSGRSVDLIWNCRECAAVLKALVTGVLVMDRTIAPAKRITPRLRDCASVVAVQGALERHRLTLRVHVGPVDELLVESVRRCLPGRAA